MTENKWQVNRAGILNYWYYDEEEFQFADGRLLLRGSNGSGKSVTMQSLVTLLLDGVKRADRLDSFGSRARRIEDYLLGEKEISSYEDRTGYLYLEYKREQSDQYVTTGIGLHARRGSTKVDFWGFVLYNGRRIGDGLQLYKIGKDPETGKEQRLPLSRRELEGAIGTDGRVTTEQREYMALVNQYVFGFADLSKYEELMQLLIQLRSPKLSRDFKPSVIYEILNDSLPSLSDGDLRPLAETMESMEKTRLSIEQLEREKDAFNRLCNVYDNYNEAVLVQRSLKSKACQETLESLSQQKASLLSHQQELIAVAESAAERQQELQVEETGLRTEQQVLQENEAYKAAEQRQVLAETLSGQREDYEKKQQAVSAKRRRELELDEQCQHSSQQRDKAVMAADECLAEMDDLAVEACFGAHETLKTGFSMDDLQAGEYFTLWMRQLDDYEKQLQVVCKLLQVYEDLQRRCSQADQDLGRETKLLDEYSFEYQRAQELLQQAREQLIKRYYEWKKEQAEVLVVEPAQEQQLVGMMQELYVGTLWPDVQSVLEPVFNVRQQALNKEIGTAQQELEQLLQQLSQAETELLALRQCKEAEPELEPAYQAARSLLREQGVTYLPFYEAVEFREQVPAEQRERLESALLAAGILDAVILADEQAAAALPVEMYGVVLSGGTPVMMGESLYDYLRPVPGDSGLSEQRIAAVLSSIEVDQSFYEWQTGSTAAVNPDQGTYRLGNTAGHAAAREAALYIGRQAREAYRRQQIQQKQQEIVGYQQESLGVETRLAELQATEEKLSAARQAFPSEAEVHDAYSTGLEKQKAVEQQQERVRQKDAEKKQLLLHSRCCQQDIYQERGDIALEVSLAAYDGAKELLADYYKELQGLRLQQNEYAHATDNLRQQQESLDYIRVESDELQGEIVGYEMAIRKAEQQLAVLDRQLLELDAAAVEQRIVEVVRRLQEIPKERELEVARQAKAETMSEQLNGEIAEAAGQQEIYTRLNGAWQSLYQAEVRRGLVSDESAAQERRRKLEQKWQQADESPALSSLVSKVTGQFMRDQGILTEYRISFRDVTDEVCPLPDQLSGSHPEVFRQAWQELREQASRQLVLAEVEGQPQNPYEQRAWLLQHIEEQKELLSEQDRRIYKEIIMNSIGRTISEKIYAAEDWIRKMNGLMQKSETSSALRFRLDWKPVHGENDDELDTSELVELLHADPESLRDEDMEKIVRHFQARIERAQQNAMSQERDVESFQSAVRDLLDYRQWFRFQLSYDQGEQIRHRELTDRAFFQFSGGEKAMAMYIPLFSAAYSRYLEAGADAPYLITLDEAFAGVDEENIRDMFRLVEQLHFNYIMNSQVLWGDYDVVPSLNVYELLRPRNAAYVTVVGSHWDGHVRKLMTGGAGNVGPAAAD